MKVKINVLILLFLFLSLNSCSKDNTYKPNYDIAVIETTGQKNNSIIHYYNENLKLMNSQSLPYGSMGNVFYNPVVYQNKLYSIPQGLANKKDLKKVIELDLNNGKINEFTIDELAMNSVAVNDEFIFTCNTLNGTSYINRCNKIDKKTIQIHFPDVYISKLVMNNDKLYAFGVTKSENSGTLESYLYILDTSLKIIDKINISDCGSSQYKTAIINDELYFSNQVDDLDNPSNIVSIYTEDEKLKNIKMDYYYPSDLIQYKEFILIAHCDLVRNEGNVLTIFNTKDNTMESLELSHTILQMNVKGDSLYIIDQDNLYQYKFENNDIMYKNKIKVKRDKKSDIYYYISGFFVKSE